ncbi:MAG: elongation factor P hydroxylase [Halioglobus sp.]
MSFRKVLKTEQSGSVLRQTISASSSAPHHATVLEEAFAQCFEDRWNTRLCGGASEPYYQPSAGAQLPHQLFYREDFFASALHESAHWCIAGRERRLQADFGYWYAPEGRSAKEQADFEAAECKPQALEWIFSRACDYPFRPSIDNFQDNGEVPDTGAFNRRIVEQAIRWQFAGLPDRAGMFFAALSNVYGNDVPFPSLMFDADQLVV